MTYPLMLDLTGRPAVVVGGGQVALRRARGLLAAGALVHVIAPQVDPALAGEEVTVSRREYRDGDLEGAWLAHAATGDPAVNARVAAEAQRLRIWCVRADDAAASAAWTPAVARVVTLKTLLSMLKLLILRSALALSKNAIIGA